MDFINIAATNNSPNQLLHMSRYWGLLKSTYLLYITIIVCSSMTTPRCCHSSLFQMPKNIIGLNNEKLISVDDKLFRVFGGTTFPHLQMIRDT